MLGARNRNSQMMEAFLTLLVQMRRQRVIAWIPERTWKVASGRHNLCLSIIIPLSCSLLHPLFIPASVDLQKQSGREMGRRGYRALLSLLLSVVLFFVFVPDPIVRAVLIPAKFDGFVYNTTGTSPDSIVIEAFFDPVCPDSRDDWLPLKRVLAYYAGRVSLIVHPFPLPYHDNAFATSRALHIVNKLNSSATYQLLEMFFKHQAMFYNQKTINMSRASIVDSIVKFVSNSVGQSLISAVKSGFSDRKTDMATRISFKYGCSRGVLGTPFYFVNGFPLPVPDSVTDYSKWRSILDPLVSESTKRENLHFFL